MGCTRIQVRDYSSRNIVAHVLRTVRRFVSHSQAEVGPSVSSRRSLDSGVPAEAAVGDGERIGEPRRLSGGVARAEASAGLRRLRRMVHAAEFTDQSAAHITAAVGVPLSTGTAYILVSPRCGTCRSEYRSLAEDVVVVGESFRSASLTVEEARQPDEPGLTERQIRHHFRAGHHPAGPSAYLTLRRVYAELCS